MTEQKGSALATSSSEELVAGPLTDRLPGSLSRCLDDGELVVGEADRHGVAAGIAARRSAGSGAHESRIAYTGSVDADDLCVYDKSMTATRVSTGADVKIGDAITFAPGNKPIRIHRIDAKQWHHPTLEMTYRVFYDVFDTGYVLFDSQTIWILNEEVA